MNLWLMISILAVAILIGIGMNGTGPQQQILYPRSMCPLVKQGCDCGTICTKTFDCVRGQHAN